MADQKNLLLAIVISIVIMLGFQYFVEGPKVEKTAQQATTGGQQKPGTPPAATSAPGATAPTVPSQAPVVQPAASRQAALDKEARVTLSNARIKGSISLLGGRVDDLTLNDYRQTPKRNSDNIVLLSPTGAPSPYYVEYGWTAPQGETVALPGPQTLWTTNKPTLSPGNPVTLAWDNGAGLRFKRTIEIDENYLLSITEQVENYGGTPVSLHRYALISRHETPKTEGFYILHEGGLGVFDGTLSEEDYSDLKDKGRIVKQSTGGWIGITDKYWMTALIPDQNAPFTASFNHTGDGGDKYQVDYLLGATSIPAGNTATVSGRLFAGAKEVHLMNRYHEAGGITRFDLTIDWGWFNFLTRPLFIVIDYFNRMLGNFGLAILLTTVIVKLLFLPLAHKSYVSMSKMKKLQPEMTKLRERFGEDRQRMNQELMALYKKEKVNPASGCLPIVLQIPVFFALYKVLFVTIEMRHAPFYGWIHDLSAPDPTTMFNLFGLIPWTPPAFIPLIGVWPLLMGLSMFLQQRLNPQPADPVQAKIFLLMPIFFTFLLASFPAGLVIYWTWNNLLSMAQQWMIMKRMGVKVT